MYTQHCFIRKNTPKLRDKLEELGYVHIQSHWKDKRVNKCRLLYVEPSGMFWHYYAENLPKSFFNTHFDCDTNEDLFLALAALRDDSDYMQWFCDDDVPNNKRFFISKEIEMKKHFNNVTDGDCGSYKDFHKATVEELIEHFKKNRNEKFKEND